MSERFFRNENATRRYCVVGTRAVVLRGAQDFRVVCATCDGGGTRRFRIPEDAERAACRDSYKPCLCRPPCGAR